MMRKIAETIMALMFGICIAATAGIIPAIALLRLKERESEGGVPCNPVKWRITRPLACLRRIKWEYLSLVGKAGPSKGKQGPIMPRDLAREIASWEYEPGKQGPRVPKGFKFHNPLKDWNADGTWDEIQEWARRITPLPKYAGLQRKGAAIYHSKEVAAQHKRMVRTVGGFSFLVAAIPYLVIVGGFAFGAFFAYFGASTSSDAGIGVSWTTAHTVIAVVFFGLFSLPMSFPLQWMMKYRRAYAPLRVLEFGNENEGWRITGIADSRAPRLGFINTPNAFSGSATDSGLRKGPVHLATGRDLTLNNAKYTDIYNMAIAEDLHLGFGARGSSSSQHEMLLEEVTRGQPAAIGEWLHEMMADENGRRMLMPVLDRIANGGVKPFEGAAAAQTRALVHTSIQAGEMKHKIGKGGKINWSDISLGAYCIVIAILLFLMFSTGFQVDVASLDLTDVQGLLE